MTHNGIEFHKVSGIDPTHGHYVGWRSPDEKLGMDMCVHRDLHGKAVPLETLFQECWNRLVSFLEGNK